MVRQLKNGLAFAFLATGAFANRCTVGMYDHADFGCTVCPAGKFAENPGSTDCDTCAPGKYQFNEGQNYCAVNGCPAGTFKTDVFGFNVGSGCQQCPVGTYSAAGVTECTKCPNGSYTSEVGQTECEASSCSPGYYQAVTPQLRCVACGYNTYQPLPGQNECLKCPHSIGGRGHTTCVEKTSTSAVSECSHTTCSVQGGKVTVQHKGTPHGVTNYENGVHHKCHYSKEADKCACVCWNPEI